jgi:hypothetical protein
MVGRADVVFSAGVLGRGIGGLGSSDLVHGCMTVLRNATSGGCSAGALIDEDQAESQRVNLVAITALRRLRVSAVTPLAQCSASPNRDAGLVLIRGRMRLEAAHVQLDISESQSTLRTKQMTQSEPDKAISRCRPRVT